MARTRLVAGNWKMHGSRESIRVLLDAIASGADVSNAQCAVCPPFPYLSMIAEVLRGSKIALGAQNVYPEKEGAFTGEVSPTMLLDVGCRYVIVGHSERRHKLGETNAFINRKVKAALATGLQVILCVGETLEERQANQTEAVLDTQLALRGSTATPAAATTTAMRTA